MQLSKTPLKPYLNLRLAGLEFVGVLFGEVVDGVAESANVGHGVTHHGVYEGGVEGAEVV